LKIQLFPCDDIDVEYSLDVLATRGLIVRYTVDGHRFIAIPTFEKHQNPHHREPESIIPGPDAVGAKTVQAHGKPGASPGLAVLTPDSGLLTPDSIEQTLGQTPPQNGGVVTAFERFWTLYPRKQAKGAAQKAFTKAATKTSTEAIIEGLRAQLPTMSQQERQYIPHPATWLNAERWSDEVRTPKTALEQIDDYWGGDE